MKDDIKFTKKQFDAFEKKKKAELDYDHMSDEDKQKFDTKIQNLKNKYQVDSDDDDDIDNNKGIVRTRTHERHFTKEELDAFEKKKKAELDYDHMSDEDKQKFDTKIQNLRNQYQENDKSEKGEEDEREERIR